MMYRQSFQIYFKLIGFVGLAVIADLVIGIVKERTSSVGGMMFVSILNWSYLAYITHAVVLLSDDRDRSKDGIRLVGFAIRVLALGALAFAPAIVVGFMVYLKSPHLDATEMRLLTAMMISAPILAVSFVLVFAAIGTLLPAFVAQSKRGLAAAFQRGKITFGKTSVRLFAGPVVMSAVAVLAPLSLVALYPALFFSHEMDMNFFASDWTPNIPMILFRLCSGSIYAFSVVMTAWVLSNAYLEAVRTDGMEESPLPGNAPM